MAWNWQLPSWPIFTYDPDKIAQFEREFLLDSGKSFVFIKNLSSEERNQFVVEILSVEGIESSRIEGEILERESLQSSIKQQFGLHDGPLKKSAKEQGMAELLATMYKTFDEPLSHEMLWQWHSMLFKNWARLEDVGNYRTHPEAMQIVTGAGHELKVYFEAPPSAKVYDEMTQFIQWYNGSRASEPLLGRAAHAHVYFESIHPFEDGNGRIGRLLVEKLLSQGVGQPILIAVSKFIEKHKKTYYKELQKCNQTVEIDDWVLFFSDIILQAQDDSVRLLQFLIQKSKIMTALSGKINSRQEKVLLKLFAEGPEGFLGGLSAEKYIAITKATRATATRDLHDLVEKRALRKTGELRHTRYWLNLD